MNSAHTVSSSLSPGSIMMLTTHTSAKICGFIWTAHIVMSSCFCIDSPEAGELRKAVHHRVGNWVVARENWNKFKGIHRIRLNTLKHFVFSPTMNNEYTKYWSLGWPNVSPTTKYVKTKTRCNRSTWYDDKIQSSFFYSFYLCVFIVRFEWTKCASMLMSLSNPTEIKRDT